MSELTIENVGPIEGLTIQIPDEGGICVLRGRNGRGKSQGLAAIEHAVSGRGKLAVRDGAKKGEVSACGVRVTVGRSTRRSGELEVESLDGRLSPAELVDPQIKSPDAADARRIKAIVQIAGTKPDPSLFWALVGGREEFERLIGTAAIASDDLVQMADRIKRDLEAAARSEESKAEHALGRARGAREAASGIDASQDCDPQELQTALESAVQLDARLKAEARAAEDARRERRHAEDALEDAELSYHGPSVPAAQAARDEANERFVQAKVELARAETAAKAAQAAAAAAERELVAATSHADTTAQWRSTLSKSLPQEVSRVQLSQASQAVQEARERLEQGVLIRKARQHLQDAQRSANESTEHDREAARLREAAKGTDEVLTGVVAETGWPGRVEAGRLVHHTKRGATYFGELSRGERYAIVVPWVVRRIGRPGLFHLDQEAWEGLDPQNRRMLAGLLAGSGVVMITAECSEDDEVTAEVYKSA